MNLAAAITLACVVLPNGYERIPVRITHETGKHSLYFKQDHITIVRDSDNCIVKEWRGVKEIATETFISIKVMP